MSQEQPNLFLMLEHPGLGSLRRVAVGARAVGGRRRAELEGAEIRRGAGEFFAAVWHDDSGVFGLAFGAEFGGGGVRFREFRARWKRGEGAGSIEGGAVRFDPAI